jgi:SWI/SNF-related matrix-associated actin-dependent regulator of chromatin subfamily B member 1
LRASPFAERKSCGGLYHRSEIFAQSVVDDYALAPNYVAIITKAIQDQLSDYKAHSTALLDDGEVVNVDEDVVVKGVLEGEEDEWWKAWRTGVRSPSFGKLVIEREAPRSRKRRKVVKDEETENQGLVQQQQQQPLLTKEQPMSVEDFEEDDSLAVEEMRILIKVR